MAEGVELSDMLGGGETVIDREINTPDKIGVVLAVIVMVGEFVTLEPKVLDSDKLIDTLGVSDALSGIERGVTLVVGMNVASGVDDGVKVGELLLVTITDILHELLNVAVSLPEGEEEGVGSELGVTLALPPSELLAVKDNVVEGVSTPVPVKEGVTDGVRDDDEVGESLVD